MARKQINIAVVGLGYMGQNHSRVLSSLAGVNLCAVCDIQEEKAVKIAKQYKAKSYVKFKQLFENEHLDAITICLPTPLHFEAASLAISKKIVTFVEKPVCHTVRRAQELIVLSKLNHVPIMVGHVERFNPIISEIKSRLKSKELGKILKIHAQRFSPSAANDPDVSVSVDLATHDIDIFLYILGESPISIFSESMNKKHSKTDLITSTFRFKSGVVGQIEVSWLYPLKKRSLTILGEKGMYSADYLTQELLFYKQNEDMFKGAISYLNTKADVVKIAFQSQEPLQIELEAFVEATRNKTKMPIDLMAGLKALEIATFMDKSALLHRRLALKNSF